MYCGTSCSWLHAVISIPRRILITHHPPLLINTKKVTTLNIILFLSTLQECEWAPNSGGKWWTSSAWSAGVMAESPILRNGIWMMFHNNSSAFDEFGPIKTKNHLEPVVIAGLVVNRYVIHHDEGKWQGISPKLKVGYSLCNANWVGILRAWRGAASSRMRMITIMLEGLLCCDDRAAQEVTHEVWLLKRLISTRRQTSPDNWSACILDGIEVAWFFCAWPWCSMLIKNNQMTQWQADISH
jgi:hypothetical protein